jgi:CBS domain-containing membrane protein
MIYAVTEGMSNSVTNGQDQHQPGGMPPARRSYGRIDREHPIGGEMSDIVRGLLRHILPWLTQHYARTTVLAIFSFINGYISIGLMSALAFITGSPLIFLSLGPTAFFFFYTQRAPSASPRYTLVGHTSDVLAGYFSLVVTGLTTAGPALAVGVTWPRVISAALSLGLTSGLMVLFKSPHPPAGATTLIISLGLITKPWQLLVLLVLLVAVVLLTLQALAINWLAGIPYPLWNPIKEK